MSRVLQPHPEGGLYWAMAFALSVAVHAGVVVYSLDLIPFNVPEAAPPVSFPDIAISNTVLERQQLAAMEPEDAAQTPAETAEEAVAEEPTQPEAEELPATEAEDLAQAESEQVAPAEAEDLAQAEPEELAALEPLEPEAPAVPEQLSPILPDEPLAQAAAATPLSPTLAPITPDNNGTSIQGATLAPVAPVAVAAAPVVSSVQPITRVAPAVPPPPRPAAPAPTPAAIEPPSPEDLAVLALIERIQNRFGDTCLIALPQSQGPGLNPLVTLISDQERSMSTFVTEVLSDPDLPVDERRVLIDSRQCPALDYVRAHRSYPAFRIDLTLQSRVIASGNNMRGRIQGLGARYTSVLAVDSNGVVTDLRRFTQFQQGTALLDVPVNVNGAPRDTSHLLLAIATPGLPSTVAQRAGWLAQDFFPQLREETQGRTLLGILAFDVR